MKNYDIFFDFDKPIKKPDLFESRLNLFKKAFISPQKLTSINDENLFSSLRHVETIKLNSDNVICTTYFNTKQDPQRGTRAVIDDIKFISPWYYSMLKMGLFGVVFYDNLSNEFIELYQTDRIKFVKCTLGDYSLNDERFILFYMFFLKHKTQNIFLTDGNDVILNKNPFSFIETQCQNKIFVGRGKENKLYQSQWNLNSINKLINALNIKVPNNFYEMSIYNAGIIGGNYFVVMYFLRQICTVFFEIDNKENNNMAAMHYVLYYYFYPNCRSGIRGFLYNLTQVNLKIRLLKELKRLKLDFFKIDKINYDNDKAAISKYIYSGFPLNSKFYFFEEDSNACIIHK